MKSVKDPNVPQVRVVGPPIRKKRQKPTVKKDLREKLQQVRMLEGLAKLARTLHRMRAQYDRLKAKGIEIPEPLRTRLSEFFGERR